MAKRSHRFQNNQQRVATKQAQWELIPDVSNIPRPSLPPPEMLVHNAKAQECAKNVVMWANRLVELRLASWQSLEMADGVRMTALIFPEDKWEVIDAVLTYKGG